MEKKSLGRGIGALISTTLPESEKYDKAIYVKLAEIKPSPYQPRKDFATQGLEELTQSIKEKGVIQPVLVRRQGDMFELIAGERRLRAAKLLKIERIPAIVKQVDDLESLELSLVENIQRENLNPIEEAHAFQYLIEKFGITQEKIAQVIGKSRVSITNILRLLELPQEIQEEIKKGRLSFAHGRALLELHEANQQRILAQKAIAHGLSVRELENLVKKSRPKPIHRSKAGRSDRDEYVAAVEEQLQQLFGTRVVIHKGRKRGRIQIEFYSSQDLERILEILRQVKK